MSVQYGQWVLFGDSITQQSFQPGGLGQILANTYQRRLDIVNRGYGGYNTAWGLYVAYNIISALYQRKTKAVCLWWGANDSTLPNRGQSVSVEQFKANLVTMIHTFRAKDASGEQPVIFVLSPPPINLMQRMEDVHLRFGSDVEPDRTEERTHAFAIATQEVAAAEKTVFVPVYDKIMEAAGPDRDAGLRRLLCDGLHLTPAGYEVVAMAILDVVAREVPQLNVDNMPRLFPDWSEIDPKDPGKSFPLVQRSHDEL